MNFEKAFVWAWLIATLLALLSLSFLAYRVARFMSGVAELGTLLRAINLGLTAGRSQAVHTAQALGEVKDAAKEVKKGSDVLVVAGEEMKQAIEEIKKSTGGESHY